MKTSIKLLIGIAIAVLLTMIGAGWSFRRQYDQLDHSDTYAQYSRQTLPPFRVLKVVGSPGELFLVQPGRRSTLRVRSDFQMKISYESLGDTLLVRYEPDTNQSVDDRGVSAGTALSATPIAVLSLPALPSIRVENATCLLANWQATSLTVAQTGRNGALGLRHLSIGELDATVAGGSLLRAEAQNRIGRATVTVRDQAIFIADSPVFNSLTLRADPAATVKLPGALLAKIR